MRHWRTRLFATVGQLDAAQIEVRLCRAAGQNGAVRAVEIIAPFAEARLAIATGDTAGAARALHQAADAGRQAAIAMFVPALLATRACLAAITGDDPAAAAAIAETRAALSGRHEAITHATLSYAEGIVAWHRGELAEAEHLIRKATLQWHHCSDRMDASDGVELLGVLACTRGRYGDAARLLAAADAARPPLPYLTPGFTADRRAATRATCAASHARRVLGEDGFAQAWEQGQRLTLDAAVAYIARKGGGRKRPATGWASLTPTELQVVRLVAEGLRNDAIARRLFIAPGTVKVHLSPHFH
jgi:DNA-binding NarL/FixJ family response regulator